MKVSKLSWATCPHCKILLNGYDLYPAGIVMGGDSEGGSIGKCPTKTCGKEIIFSCKVTLEFKADEKT